MRWRSFPARRRLGRAASSTGLPAAHPLRTANPNTECRNVITLRTVFGDAPRTNMRLASRSTSSVLTPATLRRSNTGEMCTRRIDSQFCR